MSAEKDKKSARREGEIWGGALRFRFREEGIGDRVVWLGESAPALRNLMAAQYRVVELAIPPAAENETAQLVPALEEALKTLGVDRFGLVAEGAQAATALRLALERPDKLAAIVLLGPRIFGAEGEVAEADASLAQRFESIAVPLLAVFGTRDEMAPPEAGRHYRARNARCNLVFVYDAGAAMGEERPDAVAELITDFLRRGDRFIVRQQDDLLYP